MTLNMCSTANDSFVDSHHASYAPFFFPLLLLIIRFYGQVNNNTTIISGSTLHTCPVRNASGSSGRDE